MRSPFPPADDSVRLTLFGVVVVLALFGAGCSGDAESADQGIDASPDVDDVDPEAEADLAREEPEPAADAPEWLVERAGDATTTFLFSSAS